MEHMYAISNWKGDNMYEYIIGKVTFVSPYYIVVETNGIGYQISVDNPYRYSGKMDTDIKLYLHQVVREDAQLLFGFGSLEEKQLFLKLISVSGIGPKSGLAIMASVADHGGLINAIEGEDVTYLTKFPCWQENSPTNDFRFKRKTRRIRVFRSSGGGHDRNRSGDNKQSSIGRSVRSIKCPRLQ